MKLKASSYYHNGVKIRCQINGVLEEKTFLPNEVIDTEELGIKPYFLTSKKTIFKVPTTDTKKEAELDAIGATYETSICMVCGNGRMKNIIMNDFEEVE